MKNIKSVITFDFGVRINSVEHTTVVLKMGYKIDTALVKLLRSRYKAACALEYFLGIKILYALFYHIIALNCSSYLYFEKVIEL